LQANSVDRSRDGFSPLREAARDSSQSGFF